MTITNPGQPSPFDQPLVVTETQPSGAIATWVFKPSTQNDYNQLLAEWQGQLRAEQSASQAAQLAAQDAGPCSVGATGHDERLFFTGPHRHEWCQGLLGAQRLTTDEISSSVGTRGGFVPFPTAVPGGDKQLCQVNLHDAQATVYDSGGNRLGTNACAVLQRLSASGTTNQWENWDKVMGLLDGMGKVNSATSALAKATNFGPVLDSYKSAWKSMQDAYAKEQADAKVVPLSCSQKYTVQSDSYSVQSGLYSVQSAGYSMQNAQRSVADARPALAVGLDALDGAIKTSPPGAVQDARAVSDAGQKQLAATDAATDDAKQNAHTFDDEADALNQQAAALVNGLSCK
jgi:hypothetical protein